jgi:multidrug resistance efflux pump
VRIVLDGGASTLGRLRPGLSVTVNVDERAPAQRTSAQWTADQQTSDERVAQAAQTGASR